MDHDGKRLSRTCKQKSICMLSRRSAADYEWTTERLLTTLTRIPLKNQIRHNERVERALKLRASFQWRSQRRASHYEMTLAQPSEFFFYLKGDVYLIIKISTFESLWPAVDL